MVTQASRGVLARFAPAASATAVLGLIVVTHRLSPIPRGIAIACVVASWAAAVVFARRDVRTRASVVAAIAAVTAAGQTEGGVLYGLACAGFLFACVAAMRAVRAPRARTGPAARPPGRVLLVLFATAACVTASLIAGLPWLAVRVERRVNAMFGGAMDETTAFSTTMRLGATHGMLQSDTIVMRIDGGQPEYLRGAVYDRYGGRYWTTSATGTTRRIEPAATLGGGRAVEITLARGAPEGEDMRWFLPAGACDLATSPGTIEVDTFGIARRARGEGKRSITFRSVPCSTAPAGVAPPSLLDVDVPRYVSAPLAAIATEWVRGASTDRAKLEAIKRELGRFEYSLSVDRDPKLDPIVDFVTVHRAGHCELFASAMALMARTQGIPTRVIGGYHVSEVNPLTGRAVVRERNAHAWVEAWIDGAWRAWDPTPVSEGHASSNGTLDHLGDVLSGVLDRVAFALGRLGPLGIAGVLASILALFLLLRATVRSVSRRLRDRGKSGDTHAHAPPLPCFDSLSAALASAGHERAASEPLEAFAARLTTAGTPWAAEASSALLRYAGLRYGGIGDEKAIVRDVDRAARAIRG